MVLELHHQAFSSKSMIVPHDFHAIRVRIGTSSIVFAPEVASS